MRPGEGGIVRRFSFGKPVCAGAAGVLLLVAVGCSDPIVNAPPGGGTVVEATFRLGPFNLAPMGQSGDQSQSTRSNIPRPTGAFGLKTIDFDLVDASGNPIPRMDVHLHHVVLMNTARTSPFCSNWNERFAGAGTERTPLSLPDPYAYMVGANDHWNALWHVMNMSDMPHQVFIQYRIGYQPGATTQNTRPATPFFLDIAGNGCGNSEFNVPGDGGPGSVFTASKTWTVPWDGYLIGAGGHLHAGGIDLALQNATTGDYCTMTAHYGPDSPMGFPTEITRCTTHKRILAGQTVRVTARYDNSEPRAGVMGIVLAYAWRGTQ